MRNTLKHLDQEGCSGCVRAGVDCPCDLRTLVVELAVAAVDVVSPLGGVESRNSRSGFTLRLYIFVDYFKYSHFPESLTRVCDIASVVVRSRERAGDAARSVERVSASP